LLFTGIAALTLCPADARIEFSVTGLIAGG